jgi:hypothetical protein
MQRIANSIDDYLDEIFNILGHKAEFLGYKADFGRYLYQVSDRLD